jgi:small subunit ribosomal protein S1
MLKNAGEGLFPIDNMFIDDDFKVDASDAEQLSQAYIEVSSRFKENALIKGLITSKNNGGIVVAVDYKSDTSIPAYEFSEHEFEALKVGEDIEVIIEDLEDSSGALILSYQKAKSAKVWNDISDIAEKGGDVTGRVIRKVKGGLRVDIGIPAFLPGSQIDVHRVSNFDQFMNQDVTCKVIKINRKRGNVIVSRRKFIEEERNVQKKKSLEVIDEGQVIKGTVKNITTYGAFVDVGGIDGLLHVTDMSWGRISHPSEILKVGDEVTVKIISFDKENEKISLGMKQLSDNPWQGIAERFSVGSKVKGKISSIMDYGLFVEVTDGVEGLVHISEISWTERVQDLKAHYNVGDSVDVTVTSVEGGERRMSLSIKRLNDDPWRSAFDKFKPGDNVAGKVSNVTDFGIFVTIHPGVDGLVHVSDVSWTDRAISLVDKYKKGEAVNVVVLFIDQDKRRISLGIKQLDVDPWENVEKDFVVGSEMEGVVSKVTGFGVFVKFDNGLEGLAHISELSDEEITDIDSFLPVGTRKAFRIVKSSSVDRKLGLSLKSPDSSRSNDFSKTRTTKSLRDKNNKSSNFSEGRERNFDSGFSDSKGSLQMALERVQKDSAPKKDKKE